MTRTMPIAIDPRLDLVLERNVDVPRESVWKAWTTPEQIMQWFTPKPWETVGCDIELKPGGEFKTVMRSPDGKEFPNTGCYLEVIPNERLVWTAALQPGFRPAKRSQGEADLVFTGAILLEPHGKGTKYTAIAMHADEESCRKHADMGFHAGWGMALDQMVAMIKKS